MDTTWPLSAAVVGLMILQVSVARNQLGSWFAPGAFFGLIWAVVGVLSLSIAPEFRIWPGILWVLFMSCTAHLGGLLVSHRIPVSSGVASPGQPLPLAVPLLLVSAILGVCGVLYLVSASGQQLGSLLSISQASIIMTYFSGLRYTDPEYREPAMFRILSVFTFLGAYLGGMVFARSGSRSERLAALSGIVPALLETFVLGARTGLISFGITWIASWCATRVYMGERRIWPNWRRALTGLGAGLAAMTGLYLIVQVVRMGTFLPGAIPVSAQYEEVVLKYSLGAAKVQIVGYAAAFSKWFDDNWDVWQTPGLGSYSFDGPAGWLGYSMGRNPDPIEVSPYGRGPEDVLSDGRVLTSNSETNVFSALRQMAFDWTLPGSSIFFLILSVVASFAYVKVCGRNAAYIPLTVLYYQIALYVTSFALRNTVTDGAWVLFAGYLWLVSGADSSGFSPGPETVAAAR